MAKVKKGGDFVAAGSLSHMLAYVAQNGGELVMTDSEKLEVLRAKINDEAGDLPSLVGTVSDGSGLLLEQVARAFVGLAAASSLAKVQGAVADAAALFQPLLDQIDAGEVVLPHHVTGAESVLADVAARSTTVSNVLIAAAGE
jgi:hypothetical protein